MQDVSMRMPSVMVDNWQSLTGGPVNTIVTAADGRHFIRRQVGYRGPRPKVSPMPVNAYQFDLKDLSLRFQYDRTNIGLGRREWGEGDFLSTSLNAEIVFDNSELQAIDNRLSSRCLDKLTDKVRGGLDLSVDIAEAHQTKKMLKVTDQLVGVYETAVRKYGPLKLASNLWLMNQYGIQPLLSSLYGAADESLRLVINKVSRHSARVSEIHRPRELQINTVMGFFTLPTKSARFKRSWTIGVDLLNRDVDLARWTSLNPISLAWETLPLSFVADWVFNVGGYLRNMETMVAYSSQFRSGYRTILMVGDASFATAPRDIGPNYINRIETWKGNARLCAIDRIVLAAYPAPRLPSFDARLGSSRLLSAAALLAQLLPSRHGTEYSRYSEYLGKVRKNRARRINSRYL